MVVPDENSRSVGLIDKNTVKTCAQYPLVKTCAQCPLVNLRAKIIWYWLHWALCH